MGKPTGFMEFDRQMNPSVEPKERIQNFDEFHPPLSKQARCEQGARCMDCGVPFCQSAVAFGRAVSGCPLHNLIPEWNDALYKGDWAHALSRLLKTDNFPEFTGRVCPALCEAACTCGLHDQPVTIRENELAIVENGFAQGYIRPQPPAVRSKKKVAVVGSGPAGLAAADMLNKRGHWVTIYEKNDRPGGLLMYGIPNMKLDKKIVKRRTDLMLQEGITFVCGAEIGKTKKAAELLQEYDAVLLCCGAENPRDLAVAGRDSQGVHFAVDFLTANTKHLLDGTAFIDARGKDVVIVGGGDTGNDCVGTCIRQGCKSVVQLEMMPKAPDQRTPHNPWPQWPFVSKTDYGQQEAIAVFGHDPRVYQTTIKEVLADEDNCVQQVVTVQVAFEDGKLQQVAGSEKTLACQLLIIAAGFTGSRPCIAQEFGVDLDVRTNIQTAVDGYATSVPGVFAAGDVRRGQSLVVWAIAEGRAAAREVDAYLMGYTDMI